MKTNNGTTAGPVFKLRAIIAAAAVLLSGTATFVQAAAFSSPVGTWDCVMSGKREGVAYLTFAGDNTFTGIEILVPKVKKPSERGGSSTRTEPEPNPTDTAIRIYGSETVDGPWGFNTQGKVLGYFIETAITAECTTNTVITSITVTNGDGSTTTTVNSNIVINCPGLTNAVSFTGTVSPGKRITLVCSTTTGKVIYQGIPAVAAADASGTWFGANRVNSQSFTEFFTMTPAAINGYNVTGGGPGYSYTGIALVSRQKKIAFALSVDPGDSTRAVVGPYNPSKRTGKTKGWDQPAGPLDTPAKFSVSRMPALP